MKKRTHGGLVMIKIAIVEDEDIYVSTLMQYLEEFEKSIGETLEITVYRDGDGIIADYKAQYDIILMDIGMRFVDGMTAAEEIREIDSEVIIIFITNMTQYAIRGYEVDALDYILKPVSYFSFSQKLGRAIYRMKRREKKFITVTVKGGIKRMEVSNIYYMGVICGVTTNPSLIAKEGRQLESVIAEIANIVDGPISGEVKATTMDAKGMIEEGRAIAASVRNPIHVLDCAKAGANISTVPYKVIEQMITHPLTEAGIRKFQEDYNSVFGK